MDHDDRATDTGVLGRRRQCVTTAMSDAGHDRTRLGSHEYVHARQ